MHTLKYVTGSVPQHATLPEAAYNPCMSWSRTIVYDFFQFQQFVYVLYFWCANECVKTAKRLGVIVLKRLIVFVMNTLIGLLSTVHDHEE